MNVIMKIAMQVGDDAKGSTYLNELKGVCVGATHFVEGVSSKKTRTFSTRRTHFLSPLHSLVSLSHASHADIVRGAHGPARERL